MKDFTSISVTERVRRLEQKFIKGLGEARVRKKDNSILLLFDLNDRAQMQEFNHFGTVTLSLGAHMTINALSDNKVEVRLPVEQENPLNLLVVAERMAPSIHKTDTETVRRITPGEPAHIIASLTKTPWNMVEGSPYQSSVLEPVQKIEVTDEVRKKQETGVGYVLNDDGRALWALDEWLAHQREVERKNGMKPRTVLPAEWASRDGIDRVREFEAAHPKRPLAGLFSK